MGGAALVVIIAAAHGVLVRQILIEKVGEHGIGLLAHLVAVQPQRMIVQQQGEFLLGDRRQVQRGQLEEAVILGMDAQGFIVGQVHRVRRAKEGRQFLPRHAGGGQQPAGQAGLHQPAGDHRGAAHGFLRAGVGVEIVVHHAAVLVRPGHRADAEAALVPVPGVQEEARRLHQDLAAPLGHVGQVIRGVVILKKGVGDIAAEVILRRARGEIARTLRARDGAPGIQRAAVMAHDPGVLPRGGQDGVAIIQQAAGQRRVSHQKEGKHIDLRIPEVVTLIALAGQPLGGQAADGVAARGAIQAVEAEIQAALQGLIPPHGHAAAQPESLQHLPLPGFIVCHGKRPGLRQDDRRRLRRVRMAAAVREHRVFGHGERLPLFQAALHPGLQRGGPGLHRQSETGRRRIAHRHRQLQAGGQRARADQAAALHRAHLLHPQVLQRFAGHAGVVRVGEVGHRAFLPADEARPAREVERLDRVPHDEQLALRQRGHALHGHLHLATLRRAPADEARHQAALHVQRAAAGQHLAGPEGFVNLVLQEKAQVLHIGQVDNTLLGLGKAVQLLAIADRFHIVKGVDVGPADAGYARGRPFLRTGAHAQVSVGGVKQALLQGVLCRVPLGAFNAHAASFLLCKRSKRPPGCGPQPLSYIGIIWSNCAAAVQ